MRTVNNNDNLENNHNNYFALINNELVEVFEIISNTNNYVAGLINTSIPQTFKKRVIDDKLGKNDKNKRVNSKGQELFGESISIKIGQFWDEDVV